MRLIHLIALLMLLLPSSGYSQVQSLQQVLQQVRQGSQQEQLAAKQFVHNSQLDLQQLQQQGQQLNQQLQQIQQHNLQLEDQLLVLQQQLKDKQSQLNTEKSSLTHVFQTIAEHEQLLLDSVRPHSLWQHDTSGINLNNEQLDLARIKQLWQALTEQIVLTASVQQHDAMVLDSKGQPHAMQVTEYGPFTAQTEQGWLHYLPAQKQWQIVAQQPQLSHLKQGFWLDPSMGQLIQQAGQNRWWQALAPAGLVGVLIALIAIVATIIGVNRLFYLYQEKQRINRQQTQVNANLDNALGRIIAATNTAVDANLAAHLHSAILNELPALQKGIGTLAVLAGIPPLLGLLGTVGGMIETFTVMTQFGSNNSELLSGGIAQALLTTQLGLMTAIPLLLLHCAVKNKSRQLSQQLEQEAAAIVIQQRQNQD